MTTPLTDFQKALCNKLQKGLPIDAQPFARMAHELGCPEEQVLGGTRRLREMSIIRRIGVILNHRVLGMSSTLVAAHVPQGVLPHVVEAVNELTGVSHSYLRRHHFNLWFTLQDSTPAGIDATLADLHARFAVDFHSLPVVTLFKLDVYFDAFGPTSCASADAESRRDEAPTSVELTAEYRRLLSLMQDGLKIAPRPFDELTDDVQGTLALLQKLVDLGVIRRIAAVVDYRKLGYVTNVLFVAQVPPERIIEAGQKLAESSAVSHCYERRTSKDWPYNLYAMLHGRTEAQVQQVVDEFLRGGDTIACALLPTEVELKKHPVRLSFAFDS